MSKVPAGWVNTKLQNIAKIKSGSTPLRAKGTRYFTQNGTPWVKTLDLNNSEIHITDEEITDLALKETSCTLFPANTVLVAMYGGFNQIGRTGLITKPSASNQALSGLILNEEIADPKYVLNYLNGNVSKWKEFAASSRKDPNITRDDVCNFPILLPPLPEQTKIAQILSTWDKAIATTEQLIGNSQQQKKALMQSLLTGKKRLPGFEGEFKYLNFSDVVGIDQQNLKNKTADDFYFKYISLADVKFGVIEKSLEYISFKTAPSRARRILKEGDILLATVRPNLQGFARVKKEHSEMIASTGFSVLSPKKSFCSDYIFHYLYSDHLTAQIDSLVVGSNYPAINSSDVANLKIFCPEYNEQVEIAKVLNNCLDTIENMQKKLAFLKQEKAALMQQLLTGKRRVRVEAA